MHNPSADLDRFSIENHEKLGWSGKLCPRERRLHANSNESARLPPEDSLSSFWAEEVERRLLAKLHDWSKHTKQAPKKLAALCGDIFTNNVANIGYQAFSGFTSLPRVHPDGIHHHQQLSL